MTGRGFLCGFSEPVWKFNFIRNIYVIGNANKFKLQYLDLYIIGFMEAAWKTSHLII